MGVVGLALMTVIGLIEVCLIIWYLKSKPLGSQTLLDRLFIDAFAWFVIVIVQSTSLNVVEWVSYVTPETAALVVSLWFRFCVFSQLIWMTILGLVNGIMVYFPAIMDQVSEDGFMKGARLSMATLAAALTALGHWLNQTPLSYIRLTQKYDLTTNVIIPLILIVIAVLVMLSLKLSLVITKRILSEGEANLLPLDFILAMAFGILVLLVLKQYMSYGDYIIRFFVTPICSFSYPSLIIWRKPVVRDFVFRKLAINSIVRVYQTMTRPSVHPEIELNVY